jgi:hypothetical protein
MHSAGRNLTEEEATIDFVLESPNRWLTLLEFFLDPTMITRFMQSCSVEIVGADTVAERVLAFSFLRTDKSFGDVPDNQEMQICVDVGAIKFKTYSLYAHTTSTAHPWRTAICMCIPLH